MKTLSGKVGLITLALTALTASHTPADTKPDFSGTWILNLAKSKLEMEAPEKTVFVIDHREPSFKLTRTHHWKGETKPDTWTFEITTDGKEKYGKEKDLEYWTRVYWLDDELVLDMKLKSGEKKGTNVVHYRLTDGGKTFIAAEWFHLSGHNHHNLWVFDRQDRN